MSDVKTRSENLKYVQLFMWYSVYEFLSVCKEASLFVKGNMEKEDFYMLQTG